MPNVQEKVITILHFLAMGGQLRFGRMCYRMVNGQVYHYNWYRRTYVRIKIRLNTFLSRCAAIEDQEWYRLKRTVQLALRTNHTTTTCRLNIANRERLTSTERYGLVYPATKYRSTTK